MTEEDLSQSLIIILIYVHICQAKKKMNATTLVKINYNRKIKTIFLVQDKTSALFHIIN